MIEAPTEVDQQKRKSISLISSDNYRYDAEIGIFKLNNRKHLDTIATITFYCNFTARFKNAEQCLKRTGVRTYRSRS